MKSRSLLEATKRAHAVELAIRTADGKKVWTRGRSSSIMKSTCSRWPENLGSGIMKAAIFESAHKTPGVFVQIEDVPRPQLAGGHVLLRVLACGVCRTDLHIVEGDLPPLRPQLIPGHQIVGEVVEGATAELPLGTRVGVSWMGGADGNCPYCRRGLENLCDSPVFTGYTVNGGYAEYATARGDFVYKLPAELDDLHAAPLLCAGIIGFRSLRVAGVERGERVGLFGFGASAHLAIEVLKH